MSFPPAQRLRACTHRQALSDAPSSDLLLRGIHSWYAGPGQRKKESYPSVAPSRSEPFTPAAMIPCREQDGGKSEETPIRAL